MNEPLINDVARLVCCEPLFCKLRFCASSKPHFRKLIGFIYIVLLTTLIYLVVRGSSPPSVLSSLSDSVPMRAARVRGPSLARLLTPGLRHAEPIRRWRRPIRCTRTRPRTPGVQQAACR